MREILRASAYVRVADGTEVAPLLNAARGPSIDGDVSLANGRLAPGTHSAVHFHPVITQITCVLTGQLEVWMREPNDADAYRLDAGPGDAVVTQPGTLLQLRNDTATPTTVLYVVTPGYLQALGAAGEVVFDDAVIAGTSWDSLHTTHLDSSALSAFQQQRTATKARLPRQT